MEVENNVIKAMFQPCSFRNHQHLQVMGHPFCAFVSSSAESLLKGIYTDMELFYLCNFWRQNSRLHCLTSVAVMGEKG